jgi:hypothetical protein
MLAMMHSNKLQWFNNSRHISGVCSTASLYSNTCIRAALTPTLAYSMYAALCCAPLVQYPQPSARPSSVAVSCRCCQVHVLNGEKYKEVCPDNTLLNNAQLRGCIIQPNHKKPLLKRESAMGSVAEDTRIFLAVEVRAACSKPECCLHCMVSLAALAYACCEQDTCALVVCVGQLPECHLAY